MDTDELLKRQRELQAVYEQVKAQLMQLPGVVGVGIGAKETAGEITQDFAFRVYVEEKKPLADIPSEQVIPYEIMGFKTDVHTVPTSTVSTFVERRDVSKYRPIKGGIAITSEGRPDFGTLGWFGTLDSDSTKVLLTNKHVAYDGAQGTTTTSITIGQDSVTDACCCKCGDIATTIVGISNNTVDCAIARLNSDIVPSLVINNKKTTTVIGVSGTSTAVPLSTVRKIGARSSFTTGVIVDIAGMTRSFGRDSNGNEVITLRTNQILVRAADTETYEIENGKRSFENAGDSGSVVVNSDNKIVGLIYGRSNPPAEIADPVYGFACHIGSVLTALSAAGHAITLSVSPAGGGASDYDIDTALPQTVITGTQLDQVLVRVLGEHAQEEPLVQAAQTHSDEIIHLINHCRPVTLAWHRKHGPAFLGAILHSAKEPTYHIPAEIDGVSRREALIAITSILDEHGSEALKAAIDRYSIDVLLACTRYDTIEEILRALHNGHASSQN